jgi:hypothetical protein
MPVNVRNFWIEVEVDGKKTKVATGPRAKDGGFMMNVFQRNNGGVVRAGKLQGFAHSDGRLVLAWWDSGSNEERTLFETERGKR